MRSVGVTGTRILHIEQKTHRDLLCSRSRSSQIPVIACVGRNLGKSGRVYMQT